MVRQHAPFSFWFLATILWFVLVQAKTQSPERHCLGGAFVGIDPACDANNFDGLQGHPASEILYEIIMQADLPNDTFYSNESHVTCLFKDAKFFLDFGVEAGAKGVGVSFDIDIRVPGIRALCVFPKDVPKGGLTLGEIRELSRALIDDCEKCGRITKNYLSKNESDLGWLDFNWKKSAICQDNCIDPEKDLKTVNSTSADDDENGGMSSHGPAGLKLTLAILSGFWLLAHFAL
ncbi:uncharacterized protein NECHADRAFT_89220 [Fusarium vanettenii 77-13-4]|uniref:Ecp2 effector protein domain-containing protein n=1 Tax=Fusarium vanettenii (strain ATCC MYA-4622 / CBS 123669 / FGSC 9596 / NRRL 45880 / 77-13-4) TaxID=660122 RepID=C7ZQJ4_FUSV7|nr:uncharacterized protein NECHADRAFT_89220 [Fusarium vanettenii 77-13-4]EEU33716.1 predicted protein [Fusarium vanettenii 77-13-4]